MTNQFRRPELHKGKKKPTGKVGRPPVFTEVEEVKPRLYFNIDGVITDLELACKFSGLEMSEFMVQPGTYASLLPYPGAIKSILTLMKAGCDIWLVASVPIKNPGAAGEKLHWVSQYLPGLMKKVIIKPEGKLGTDLDYFIDTRKHGAKTNDFAGKVLHFGNGNVIPDWEALVGHINDILHLELLTDSRYSATL